MSANSVVHLDLLDRLVSIFGRPVDRFSSITESDYGSLRKLSLSAENRLARAPGQGCHQDTSEREYERQ